MEKKINDNTHTQFIKSQKDYILLAKDNDMSSKNFINERFLHPKFGDKLSDEL